MSNASLGDSPFQSRLREASGWLFWLGLAMVALGIAAIVYPRVSTLVAELLVGWLLLFSGALTFFGSFSIRGTGPFFGALLLSLLSIAAGVFMLANPVTGAAALTMIVGIIFVFEGAFEIFFAFEIRSFSGWLAMLISGIASIVLAIMIAVGWPAISTIVLGILFGVDFISTGLAYIFVSRAFKAAA